MDDANVSPGLFELLPTGGIILAEPGHDDLVLCKPKLLQLKAPELKRLDRRENEMMAEALSH
jgi:hypothetical protein